MIPCILGRCPLHQRGSNKCNGVLDHCGAGATLDKAKARGGYAVMTRDNPVIAAMLSKGLVRVKPTPVHGVGLVYAE